MKKTLLTVSLLAGALLFPALSPAQTVRFEAEEVLEKPASLPLNPRDSDAWSLWTLDKNAKAWSKGGTLRHFKPADMAPEKADQLHFVIPVKESGRYALFASVVRNAGFSVDGGRSWQKINGLRALITAKRFSAGDKIRIQAANCFATPGNKGTVYIDYFELRKIPAPALLNPDFSGSFVKGVPEGWHFYTVGNKKSVIRKQKNGVRISSNGPGWSWLLTNNSRFACSPFDRFRVTGTVVNTGSQKNTIGFQFVGFQGGRLVNHSVAAKHWTLKPGEEKKLELLAVVPEQQLENVAFRLVGYQGDWAFKDFKLEELENSLETFGKNKFNFDAVGHWQAEKAVLTVCGKNQFAVKGKSGELWTLRSKYPLPALAGKGVRISLKATGKNAKVRVRVVGMLDGEQCRMALNPADFTRLTNGKTVAVESVAFLPATACNQIGLEIDGTGEVKLSDLEAAVCARPEGTVLAPRKMKVSSAKVTPRVEGRGVIVRPLSDDKVYISWRLTSKDPKEIAFDVFGENKGRKVKLNKNPLRQTTDFITAKLAPETVYHVVPCDPSHGVAGKAKADLQPYRSFKLSDPAAKIWSITPADLDGDGEYEYVVRAATDSTDPWHTAWRASKKPFFIEAFSREGKRLWTYDLSFNVESGVWYTPFTVGDFNGDGKDEVALKGSDWTEGDWREKSGVNKGKVLAGPEYLIVLEGISGKEIARAPWPCREKFFDGYMGDNYAARNQIALFRPDGKTECILALRGTYGLMTAEAWQLKGKKLHKLWSYSNEKLPRKWWGQGAHSTRIADLDGDGRDEVILGAAVLEDDGSPLWTTGCGHPDYIYVSDITKKNPGLEVLSVYETGGKHGGFTCADGKTGKIVWELKEPHRHIHCAYSSDMDARFRGWESGGDDSINGGHTGPKRSYHFSPDGQLLGFNAAAPYNNYRNFVPRFAYFDADLQREVIEPVIRDHRGGDSGGSIGGSYFAQFDSEGDWREEIVIRRPGGFRIYGSLMPAMDRRTTLMADPVYRYSVFCNAAGYSMTPSMSTLLSDHAVNLNLTMIAPDKLEITVSAPLDKKIKGTLALLPPKGVTLAGKARNISLDSGGLTTFVVKVRNPQKNCGFIEAVLKLSDGTVLKGRVPAASKKQDMLLIPRCDIHIEAENFASEDGGNVKIRSDKRGMHKKCFSHWDDKWHIVTWKFKVDKPGLYTLMLRSASAGNAQRKLFIDGKEAAMLDISGTGGNGDNFIEWQSQYPLSKGKQVFFKLTGGQHTLSLENADGNALNLDCILLKKEK